MRAVEVVFAVVWAAFWLYWLVAALSMKRGRVPWSRELGIRAVIIVLVILLARSGAFRHRASNTDLWLAGAGLVLFAAGLGFAIWARLHIGPFLRAAGLSRRISTYLIAATYDRTFIRGRHHIDMQSCRSACARWVTAHRPPLRTAFPGRSLRQDETEWGLLRG